MRKLLLGLLASTLTFGMTVPAFAHHHEAEIEGQAYYTETFIDQAEISSWSADFIQVLVDLGVMVGYPDGSFGPKQNITREEFAVALVKAMVVLEDSVLESTLQNDVYLYEEIVALQAQVLELLTELDEVKARQLVEHNNFIAISIAYTPDRDGDTAETSVEVSAKFQIIELSDTFAISIRPWVNSNTELGGAVTLDADLSKDLEVYAGVGAAYRADQNATGALTGFDNDVVPYGTAGITYNISDEFSVTLDGKVPFNSGEGKEATVQLGVGYRF